LIIEEKFRVFLENLGIREKFAIFCLKNVGPENFFVICPEKVFLICREKIFSAPFCICPEKFFGFYPKKNGDGGEEILITKKKFSPPKIKYIPPPLVRCYLYRPSFQSSSHRSGLWIQYNLVSHGPQSVCKYSWLV
jgi:hypothetical protein